MKDATRTVRFVPAAVDIEIPAEFCPACAGRLELCRLRRSGELGARGYCDHNRVGVLVALTAAGPRLTAWRDTPAYTFFKAVYRLSVVVDAAIVAEQRGALH
jgi:hypothetical protein